MRPAEACAWCGAPFDGGSQRLDRRTGCRRCGAATTDPRPDDAELEAAYGDWYRPAGGGRFNFAGDAILGRTRGLLARRLDEIAPPGPILDVGAGEGTLLDALAARGREVTGLERGAKRGDFVDGSIEAVRRGDGWAAVVFWHSLEHLPRPRAAIREAARLLAPGGVLIVAVPNTGSIQARLFGDRWLHLDIPRHLVHLSTATLTTGLGDDGFRVEAVSHLRAGQVVIGWLAGLVASLPGGLDLYQALRRPEARLAPLTPARRIASLAAGAILLPLAAAGAAAEIPLRRGGTVYVEARRI
ncbi:MAG: class I SAM-dependent methyltransferase [Acidobacteria bacterium]|nr:MAG: class I SAM-dependent methyltransferase [Acidobacteriota bacterium]MCL4287654.1 methyltransferase domain-containing protein [Thermoleophilia bacterium]GIK78839.1 MAG: SAM-dependent methyltransferase [Actinomycetes bacterium]